MDPRELEKLLQYLLDMLPINQGPAPAGAGPMRDPTAGAPPNRWELPSPLNQQIFEQGGREGPPVQPAVQAPQDDFLRYLLATQEINAGPPPGPSFEPGDPLLPPPGPLGYGVNEPGARADPASAITSPRAGALPDDLLESPGGFQTQALPATPGGHPAGTQSFLAELLGNRPELLGMQTPANPTNNQQAQMMAVALEFINEQLKASGQPPIEFGNQGAGGLRAFSESQGRTPQHVENIIAKKAREAEQVIRGMPNQVQQMLGPDAARQIAENPKGQLTPGVSRLLGATSPQTGEGGVPGAADPADAQYLFTRQMNSLLGAGPERGSLLDPGIFDPGEAAMSRQMGGVDQLVTELGGMARTPDPGSYQPPLGETPPGWGGIAPWRQNPVRGPGGKTAEEIAEANRGIFGALGLSIPSDWNPGMGEAAQVPTASLPEPGRGGPSLGFVDELKRMIAAQHRDPESARFPSEAVPGNYLEQSVAAEEDQPPAGSGYGPDVLEGRPGQALGLDEAGNIRVGSGGGQVISGSLLREILNSLKQGGGRGSLEMPTLGQAPGGMTGDLGLPPMPWELGGMRELGPLPPALEGFQQELGLGPLPGGGMQPMRVPGMPMPGPGMRPFPGGSPGPEGLGLPDFLRELLGASRR